ncbi:phage gp6-like head-tail connector protein [Streptomyces sp. NPDC087850]|uniref:phage gp6-like head-tail connector protein n=1 Tax=Streptomyces sp. NPDC087850 TaxID=3365809 RepID=UPI003803FB89
MVLASFEDVLIRSREPLAEADRARVRAFLNDATGLVEDYCGRDLYRRDSQALALTSWDSTSLTIPARYRTDLLVTTVAVDGQAVTDWSRNGWQLLREAGWGQLVTVEASWGYVAPPAGLTGIVCAEVIRWLAVTPGADSERVGDVEIHFAEAASGLSLSASTRASLRPYRRMSAGTLSLRREGPADRLRRPYDFYG